MLCGLPFRCCSRICKLSMVYANLGLAHALTLYRLTPQQQPKHQAAIIVGFSPAVTSYTQKNKNPAVFLLSQRALLPHPQYAANVKRFSHNGLNKVKLVVICMGGFLLSKKNKSWYKLHKAQQTKHGEKMGVFRLYLSEVFPFYSPLSVTAHKHKPVFFFPLTECPQRVAEWWRQLSDALIASLHLTTLPLFFLLMWLLSGLFPLLFDLSVLFWMAGDVTDDFNPHPPHPLPPHTHTQAQFLKACLLSLTIITPFPTGTDGSPFRNISSCCVSLNGFHVRRTFTHLHGTVSHW